MKITEIFLGVCAAGMAITGALASYLSSPQAPYHIIRNGANVLIPSTTPCVGYAGKCRVKVVSATTLLTLTAATTVYRNDGMPQLSESVSSPVATVRI